MTGVFGPGGNTPFEREIIANVEAHGCHINWIFSEDEDVPAFAYSIGFTRTAGVPEVILFGLPQDTCYPVINNLLAQCVAGQTLDDWVRIDSLFNGYDCVVRSVDEGWLIQSYFASALWYFRTQMDSSLRRVAMLVWPDADHRFPWEEGCADWVRHDQPALYQPRLNS